jgi:uroporphyrinogen decarboxylase
MNSRERVMTALRNEMPDRVPFVDFVDEELQLEITNGKKMNTAEFAKHLGMDGIFLPGYYGDYCAPVFSSGTGPHVGEGIIKKRDDLSKVVFPDADDPAFYDRANKFIDDFGHEDLAIFFGLRPGTYATIFSIGMIDFSYAIYDDIEFVKELHSKYIDWNIKVVENLQKIDRIDFFALYDDMAFNGGPMMSPDMFRDIFVPGYKRLAEAIKIPWAFHSDGNLMPLMDDIIDLGMDCINPIEPGPMSIAEVNEKYGDKVCLWGNIDLHHTLTRGTPEEVDAEVKQRIKDAGKNGGYILSSANSCTNYCKSENVIAMAKAVKKYGKYPIDLD